MYINVFDSSVLMPTDHEPFLGRVSELKLLEDAYRGRASAFIPIYGRRRVGKSELILHFLREHRGVYFLGKQAPGALQRVELLQVAAAALGEPLLAAAAFENWGDALTAIVDRWKGPGKLVIALDEFQWTVGASPELPSVVQGLWDRNWKNSNRVMLIVCGSYVGFMEREVLGRRSPLFGRRTAQIQLKPFGYREAALFHPKYSRTDQARAYFICGGVPWYLKRFDPQRSIETNIALEILDPHGPLASEPNFLLREELREVERYSAVLGAIAIGHSTAISIAAYAGLAERALSYYVEGLIALGYVRRRYPLSEQKQTARGVRFVLDDPLLRFWFRFVYPNASYIAQMGPLRAFRDRVRGDLDAYFGLAFGLLCREALPHLYQREGITAAFEVGEYWAKDLQVDVVGLRDDRWIDLGECKWGERVGANAIKRELDAKVAHFPNQRNATIGGRIFTRKTGTPVARSQASPMRWHSLEDLYA